MECSGPSWIRQVIIVAVVRHWPYRLSADTKAGAGHSLIFASNIVLRADALLLLTTQSLTK